MTVALVVKLVFQRYLDSNVTDRFEVQLLNSANNLVVMALPLTVLLGQVHSPAWAVVW